MIYINKRWYTTIGHITYINKYFFPEFQGVYISIIDGGHDNEIIQLNSGSLSVGLPGILYENG